MVYGLVVLLLGWGLSSLMAAKSAYQTQEVQLSAQADALHSENVTLQNEVNALSDPQNLINALKAQTNYVQPGEHLIIITTPNSTSTATSSASSTGQ